METKKLSALLDAVEEGSLSKAAAKLGYTQSGITQMINSLESEMGIQLIKRDHRGVVFTEEGSELEEFIRGLLAEEAELFRKVSDIVDRNSGKIRIGAYPSIASYVLPDIIKTFKEKNNIDLQIEIKIGVLEVPKWVETGEVDFGLCEKALVNNLKWSPVQEDQLYALVPESFPSLHESASVTIETLSEYPIIVPTLNRKSAATIAMNKINSNKKILVSTLDIPVRQSRQSGVARATIPD